MSINAYKTTIRQSESPRQIERRILARLTGALEAHGDYDTTHNTAARLEILACGLRDALAENQKFWAELKYDLSQPENGLSPNLRAGLLSIALWVDRQTSSIMGGQPGVMALAGVNRTIAAGLATTPAAMAADAEPVQPSAELAQTAHHGG
ncbi:MAG: flagellar biosynthesis regulator FlaF [Paracoccaceae bacterium]|jgi:flagellar protein FlaF|nr:flagellar biosynthesis regulator FlaF [Paracoccaceae bacterium]